MNAPFVLPLEQVTTLFCVAVSFAVCRTLPSLVKFYRWFRQCGLEISQHRGFGQTASKAFGIIGAPHLSVAAMSLSGVLFVACLMAVAILPLPDTPCTALLCCALGFYHLFFSQLYCEAHVGAHVTVMVPPALILLALSAARLDVNEPDVRLAGAYTAWLCKVVLTASYCSAGISKVWTTLTHRSWIDGATLQAFVFEASLLTDASTHSSFGIPTPCTAKLQRLFMSYPRLLLAPMAMGAVAFETLAPLVLLAPPALVGLPFALFGVSFHYGICVLQNIDFVSWWGPMYAFFLVDCPTTLATDAGLFASGALGGIPAAAAASYQLAPVRTSLAAAYCLAHCIACVVLRWFPMTEVLPFSCFPMFKNATDLFDPACRKWHWLTEKPHATGTLKNYCFPLLGRPQNILTDELPLLPFKYCLVGHGGGSAETVVANVELTPDLTKAIDGMRAAGRRGRGCGATDPQALPALLTALAEAKAAFAAAPRAQDEGTFEKPAEETSSEDWSADSDNSAADPSEGSEEDELKERSDDGLQATFAPDIAETPSTFDALRRRATHAG